MGKHGLSGVLINVEDVAVCINSSHLAELLIIVDYWQVFLLIGLEALYYCFSVIIGPTLTAIQQTLGARILGAVEKENILGFADVSLEVGALVNFSGKAINKIVLI